MDFEDFMFHALGVLTVILAALLVVALVVGWFRSPESVEACRYCGAVLGGAVG